MLEASSHNSHTKEIPRLTSSYQLAPHHYFINLCPSITSYPCLPPHQSNPTKPKTKGLHPCRWLRGNTLLLDHVICQARKQRRTLSILGIDLAKAFDSISHNSIARALRRNSIDEPMVQYILQSHTNCTTTILCGPTNLPNVKLLRGVKQGDPLSPILFNLILDELLDILPPSIGISITTDLHLNCLAFADDLILISESPSTMKILINITTTFFSARSLKINATKCFCLRSPQREEPHHNQHY